MMVAVVRMLDLVMIAIIGCLCLADIRMHFHLLPMCLTRGHGNCCQPLQREADHYRQKRDQSCQLGMHMIILRSNNLLVNLGRCLPRNTGQFCTLINKPVNAIRMRILTGSLKCDLEQNNGHSMRVPHVNCSS